MRAYVVSTEKRGPGQMTGMGVMGALDIVGALDSLTGGQVSDAEQQLSTLKLMLGVSIGASVLAGLASLAVFLDNRSRA